MSKTFAFYNRFVRSLPGDPLKTNVRRQVERASYSKVMPTPVATPKLVAYAQEVAELLGMTPEFVSSQEFASVFGGNQVMKGMDPYAMNYAGHQFGQWAGQLGDGRAINLGEMVGTDGQNWTLQLKGAGPTPYSRTADGRAVLRSSIREFLCSEAMVHLGVPTTRALSLVVTGESVVRDMFYDGRAKEEPGAIVCRVAPSFLRFGNFQIHAAREEHDILKRLMDFSITNDFPGLVSAEEALSRSHYLTWFQEICDRTSDLMVHWMRVGFVHGVMNTDNMSILGLTIDYGPYGWIDHYDHDWTPNTTDAQSRRYIFGNQGAIAHWNLAQLARAILPVVEDAESLQSILNGFPKRYQTSYNAMMAAKLGLTGADSVEVVKVTTGVEALLLSAETDMTMFFRLLADLDPSSTIDVWLRTLEPAYYGPETPDRAKNLTEWLLGWQAVVTRSGVSWSERRAGMNAVNPKYVLRNYLAQEAIDRAHSGDYSGISELLEVMRRPYDEQPSFERYFAKRPDWARQKAGCSMLSCSS
ncbi:MAG: YdiU family protein [Bacteroidetes bacterium]|nr:YdiU family protein [Bacteroidota bacterium]